MAPYRRPLAVALLAGAVALVSAALAARRWGGPHGGLVLAHRVGDHTVVMGWLALFALGAAVLLGLRTVASRVAFGTPVLVLGVPLVFLYTVLAELAGGQQQTESHEAPGRADRRLVVERGHAMIDPLWYVYVHEGGWPRERRWAIGYFDGDNPDNELREAVWTGPDRIRMTTTGGAVLEVTVAPGGRPDRTVSAGW
ncbi:hypothetical protein ACFTWH_31075 [Streptomyces sp. NPDC057011]|uniref:hypothetical protein n=1 Tax=unclassified Streptomyces TaxID=2593676 RepID=UPI003633330C